MKLVPPRSDETRPSTFPDEVTDSQAFGWKDDRSSPLTVQFENLTVEKCGGRGLLIVSA